MIVIRSLTLWEYVGDVHIGRYDNDRIALVYKTKDWQRIANLTTNITKYSQLEDKETFINSNIFNIKREEIAQALLDNHIIAEAPTNFVNSWFCTYPIVKIKI